MSDYYILKGKKPVKADINTWAPWFETAERHVDETMVYAPKLAYWLGLKPNRHVSTVFLGLGHNFGPGGEPMLFETMVFNEWVGWKRWLADPAKNRGIYKPPLWLRPFYKKFSLPGTGPAPDMKPLDNYFYSPAFGQWGRYREIDCERCSTWKQAEKQHREIVKKWS